MEAHFKQLGFLPESAPATSFVRHPELALLDEVGRDLPSLLHDPSFRRYAQQLAIPQWPSRPTDGEELQELRLYYVRLGFLARLCTRWRSRGPRLPRNIAVPLVPRLPRLPHARRSELRRLRALQLEAVRPGRPDCAWAISTRCRTSCISTTNIGSSWCTWRSRRSRPRSLAAADRAAPALDPADAAETQFALARHRSRRVAASGGLRRIPEQMDPAVLSNRSDPTSASSRAWCTRRRRSRLNFQREKRGPEQHHAASWSLS